MNKSSRLERFKAAWHGDVLPSDKAKYNFICYALAAIHLLFCFAMFGLKLSLIGTYYAFTVYLYVVSLTVTIRNNNYYRTFITSYLEISVTSCLLTFLLGWSWGFMNYIIALCPVSFFVTYSLPGVKRSMTRPSIFSAISMILFVVTRIFTIHRTPLYNMYSDTTVELVFYIINCTITFISILAFSTLFALEVRVKEKILEDQNKTLSDISSIDPLTKLLNRRAMDKYLKEAVEITKSKGDLFTLAIGDIDNFKMVNDIHGHNIGDDVLKMVARTIGENLPEDATLCRWGGEEFLILIRRSEEESVPIIDAVRNAITKVTTPVEKEDGYLDLGVTMTFGVSQYIHGYSIDRVISVADANLYAGKAHGKNRVVHSRTSFQQ